GDGSAHLPEDWTGTAGEVARLFNQVVDRERAKARAEAPDRLRRTRPFRNSGDGSAPRSALNADQCEELLAALRAMRRGDDTARLPLGWPDVAGKVADAFNDLAELNTRTRTELARLSRVVGKE